jgi:polygalacturonase
MNQLRAGLFVCLILAVSGALADVNPAPPQIPERVFKLTDFGGVGDGKTLNTDAFKNAIAAVSAAGGGQLDVPAGIFLTLPFTMVSKLDLHLEPDATIQFPADLPAYGLNAADQGITRDQQQAVATKYPSLIMGNDLTDVAITGSGTIDGGGSVWWGPLDKISRAGWRGYPPPKLIILTNVKRLHVQGVTLSNSPRYHLVPTLCSDVLVEDVNIHSPPDSPNTDGIDPIGSHDVVIRHCKLDEGDDNVAIKAIPGPTYNIVVEDCQCLHGHGISIGSETYQGIHDVTVRNCTFDGTTNGVRIKSARDRGNQLYNFTFTNMTLTNVTNVISMNMYYEDSIEMKNRAAKPITSHTPFLHDVHVEHLQATNCVNAGEITGLPESPITNVTLDDVSISAEKGLTATDAKDVVFNNVTITPAAGDPLTTKFADVQWNK